MSAFWVLRYAFETGWQELKRDTTPVTWVIRILSNALFFALLGELLGSPERTQFLVVGNIVVAGALATAITVPISTWDRLDGTYPLLVIAPTSLLVPTMGRTLCRFGTGVAASWLSLAALGPLFGLPLAWPLALLLPVLLVLTTASSYGLMLCVGALANFAPQARNLIFNFTTMCLMGFCGVNVPVTFWPAWLQVLAQALPLTHGLAAIRSLLASADAAVVAQGALFELAVAIAWFVLAALTMDRMANAGRGNGSIELAR